MKLLDQVFSDIYSYIYTLSMFSSNLFFFKDLFSTEPWLHSSFFMPMKIESILINSVCLERSCTVTSSKNNFWVLITNSEVLRIKDRTLSRQWLHKNTDLINTPLLRKYYKHNTRFLLYFKPLSSFQACKHTWPCRKFALFSVQPI